MIATSLILQQIHIDVHMHSTTHIDNSYVYTPREREETNTNLLCVHCVPGNSVPAFTYRPDRTQKIIRLLSACIQLLAKLH